MKTTGRLRQWLMLLCLMASLAALGGCSAENAAASNTAAAAAATDEAPSATAPAQVAQAAAQTEYATDRYPAVAFVLLNNEERSRYVRLAEAELCPCDGVLTSLDSCLQDADQMCLLSVEIGALMLRMVKEGAGDREIGDLVQQRVQLARTVHTFDLENTPWKGSDDPVVTVVEFADFECPHCRLVSEMMSSLAEELGPRGVRLYYKHFPLQNHRNAFAASVASRAAFAQGRFWEFHDAVFAAQSELQRTSNPDAMFDRFAAQIGLNAERFATERALPEAIAAVTSDRQEGLTAGIEGTPTLFIDGVRVIDAMTEASLRARLEAALSAAGR